MFVALPCCVVPVRMVVPLATRCLRAAWGGRLTPRADRGWSSHHTPCCRDVRMHGTDDPRISRGYGVPHGCVRWREKGRGKRRSAGARRATERRAPWCAADHTPRVGNVQPHGLAAPCSWRCRAASFRCAWSFRSLRAACGPLGAAGSRHVQIEGGLPITRRAAATCACRAPTIRAYRVGMVFRMDVCAGVRKGGEASFRWRAARHRAQSALVRC